jgi:hypothetical protein
VIGSVVWFVVCCILGGYDSFSREHSPPIPLSHVESASPSEIIVIEDPEEEFKGLINVKLHAARSNQRMLLNLAPNCSILHSLIVRERESSSSRKRKSHNPAKEQ